MPMLKRQTYGLRPGPRSTHALARALVVAAACLFCVATRAHGDTPPSSSPTTTATAAAEAYSRGTMLLPPSEELAVWPGVTPLANLLRWVGEGSTLPHEGDAAKRAVLEATWFLDPERHAVELVAMPLGVTVIAWLVVRRFKRRQAAAPIACAPFPLVMQVLTFVVFAGTVFYKSRRGIKGLAYVLMPCHIFNTLCFVVSVLPSTLWRRRLLCLMLSWQALPTYALLLPDTRGLDEPFEVPFYWVQHWSAVSFPVFALATGRVQAIDNRRYWFLAWGVGVVFYMTIGTLTSMWLGVNLNFMMSPPKGFEKVGDDFRVLVTGLMLALLAVGRMQAVIYEACLRAIGLARAPATSHKQHTS